MNLVRQSRILVGLHLASREDEPFPGLNPRESSYPKYVEL